MHLCRQLAIAKLSKCIILAIISLAKLSECTSHSVTLAEGDNNYTRIFERSL